MEIPARDGFSHIITVIRRSPIVVARSQAHGLALACGKPFRSKNGSRREAEIPRQQPLVEQLEKPHLGRRVGEEMRRGGRHRPLIVCKENSY